LFILLVVAQHLNGFFASGSEESKEFGNGGAVD